MAWRHLLQSLGIRHSDWLHASGANPNRSDLAPAGFCNCVAEHVLVIMIHAASSILEVFHSGDVTYQVTQCSNRGHTEPNLKQDSPRLIDHDPRLVLSHISLSLSACWARHSMLHIYNNTRLQMPRFDLYLVVVQTGTPIASSTSCRLLATRYSSHSWRFCQDFSFPIPPS